MRGLWNCLCRNGELAVGVVWLIVLVVFPITSWPWLPTRIGNYDSESLQKWGLYLLGAGIAPLGLYLTYNRTRSLRMQTDTDAFIKSVELLANTSASARQGGIYVLEKIAKDNPERHSTIMRIMTSYIRGETYRIFHRQLRKETNLIEEELVEKLANKPMPSDIEAAIEVIRERQTYNDESLKINEKPPKSNFRFDLSNAYIFNANLGGNNDKRSNFLKTDFSDSKMVECRFDRSDLSGSYFFSSDLRRSSFVESNLKNCEFKRKTNLRDCDFKASNLSGSEFEDCDLTRSSFIRSTLKNCEFKETNFKECDLQGCKLQGCDLTDAKNLTQAQIDSANIDEATKLPKEIRHPEIS